MSLQIDRDRFFRKMTLTIAGCLEMEIALQRCLDTLADIMPVDMMAFHQYSRKEGGAHDPGHGHFRRRQGRQPSGGLKRIHPGTDGSPMVHARMGDRPPGR